MDEVTYKKCPHCEQYIPSTAMTCMHCGATVGKTKKKGVGLKKIRVRHNRLFLSCFLLFVISAIFIDLPESNDSNSSVGSSPANPTRTATVAVAIAAHPEERVSFAELVPTDTPLPPPTSTPVPLPSPTPGLRIGDPVNVGDFNWQVQEARDLGNILKSENMFIEDKKTSGRFIIVRVAVNNQSDSAQYVPDFSLIDSDGLKYESSSDTIWFVDDEEFCLLEQLNPRIGKLCTAIFEVPSSAANLHARFVNNSIFTTREAVVYLDLDDQVQPSTSATNDQPQSPQSSEAGTTAKQDANLRSGPGTNFDVVGSVSAGDALTLVGRNEVGDWYQTNDNQWIAAFLINNTPSSLPVTEGE